MSAALPSSAFAEAYRAHVMPKLRNMIESRGLFVAIGCDTFSEAINEIRHEAVRLGAGFLPEEHYDVLLDWTAAALMEAAVKAEERVYGR